jgi:hypothetical protein
LSTLLREQGFLPAAFVPVSALSVPWFRRRRPNPTLGYAETLIRHGMPFVKVELLRDNPFGRPLAAVYSALEAAGYDGSLVRFDRRQVSKYPASEEPSTTSLRPPAIARPISLIFPA